MRDGWVADSFEDAATEFGSHFVEEMRFYYRSGIFTHHPDFQSESDITAERAGPHLLMGNPQQCIEQIERYHEEFGVDYFTVRFRMPSGPSLEACREQIQRFGEEVVQPIHSKYPAPDHPAIPVACRW
jgi:alkanesulfonate monooxygenase SsuD/methylene tetrahydromethanopterin reductase-like flavin-dependent oxidoreductase (luciferase family)